MHCVEARTSVYPENHSHLWPAVSTTSKNPPTRCTLPVTRTLTSSSCSSSLTPRAMSLTQLTASSMLPLTTTSVAGSNLDHVSARRFWTSNAAISLALVLTLTRSGPYPSFAKVRFVENTACVKGCWLCRAADSVLWSFFASEAASRVCWLNSNILVDFGLPWSPVEGSGGMSDANHRPAASMLSRVCPPSICHAMFPSRRISHRPGQRTSARPRRNGGGSGDVWGAEWPRERRCADAIAMARLAFVFWKSAARPKATLSISGCGSTTSRATERSSARFCNTSSAFWGWGAVKLGVPVFMIPALCHAISSIVSPSIAVWSMPKLVMPVTVGASMMLVLSYSPPMPHSMTAVSTPSHIYVWKAINVRNRKYTGFALVSIGCPSLLAASSSRSHTSKKYLANNSSESGLLLICIRSRTNRRCGDVYRPIWWMRGASCATPRRYWARIDDMKALVDPFPLVPAICIHFKRLKSDGCTSHSAQNPSTMSPCRSSPPRTQPFDTTQSSPV